MKGLKDRLITAIIDYGNSKAGDFDAEDMAKYLIEVISELHVSENTKKKYLKK